MDKSALESSLSTLDVWLIIFGVFVAIGVVGESVAGFLHWRRSGQLQVVQTSENLAQRREIARLSTESESARASIAEANARAAEAQRETERLKADNLKMQAGLRPRRIAMLSGEARAEKFKEIAEYAGTVALIQAVPGDFEVATLARDISIALRDFDWKPRILNENDWLVSPGEIMEGVSVSSIEEWHFAGIPPQPDPKPISQAGLAAQALVALLNWDLGPPHGPPFFGVHWAPEYEDMSVLFRHRPVPEGAVVVLVGMRPISVSLAPLSSTVKDPAKP